jgi:hypothetical protein
MPQSTPQSDQLISDLLQVIRQQFYPDDPKQFFQDRRFLLRVVTWPATWCKSRGVFLPEKRYRSIFLDILRGIQNHGSTGAVKYWPGYLLHCVQQHFDHHGEEIYAEAKAVRTCIERVFLGIEKAKPERQASNGSDQAVATMAAVNRALRPCRGQAKTRRQASPKQLTFL